MIKKRAIFNKYTFELLLIIMTGLLILTTDSVQVHIFSFILLALGSAYVVDFDLSHPYFWYSFVFMLYSVAYPIMYLNGKTYDIYSYTKTLMLVQWAALSIVLIVITPKSVDYNILTYNKDVNPNTKPIMIILMLVTVFMATQIISGGYQNKAEIYRESSLLFSIGFRAVLILIILFTYNLILNLVKKGKFDIKMTIYVFFSVILIVFFSGERDLIVRVFISILFIYFIFVAKKKINKQTFLIGGISLVSLPILAKFKYFGLSGVINESSSNFILRFFSSEFQSASKNMQILLLDSTSKGVFGGFQLISSLIRGLNLDFLIGYIPNSSIQWFNNTYFTSERAGQGFTLIGEGYISFGYLGVVLVFVFVGLLMKIIYQNSNKGIYRCTFYILSIPVFMYSIRADIANLISPLINQNLISLLVAHYIMIILYKIKDVKQKNI